MKQWTALVAAVGSMAACLLEGAVVVGLLVEHYTQNQPLAMCVVFGVCFVGMGGVFELMLRED